MNPFGPLYTFDFVLLVAFAVLYYKAAELENRSGVLWAGASILIFAITWRLLHWGLAGDILAQGVLLMGITLVRVLRDYRSNR